MGTSHPSDSATVMAAIQVSLIIIVISIVDPKEIHDMPYIPKRKRPPRNRILACGNLLMHMVHMRLDACINSSMKRHRKQHHKWKVCNNKHKWRNRTGLSKYTATCTKCRCTSKTTYGRILLIRIHTPSCSMMEHPPPSQMICKTS